MPIPHYHIDQNARAYIERHGENAATEAQERANDGVLQELVVDTIQCSRCFLCLASISARSDVLESDGEFSND